MTAASIQQKPVTFSSGFCADDVCANHWMRQITLRLRREISWLWHERGALPNAGPAILPPFADRASAVLDMSRFEEEKIKFFHADPTAFYLTEQLATYRVPAGWRTPRGSFGWVVEELRLDEASTFVLALGLAAAFDNSVGTVIAACLNDPARTHPNLALAQKLWDRPEQILALADPAHPLFRQGLLQTGALGAQNLAAIDWESPIIVPAPAANQMLFPDSSLPQALAPIANGEDVTLTNAARLVASRLLVNSKSRLQIAPVLGHRGADSLEIVRGMAKRMKREVLAYRGDAALLKNSHVLNSLLTLCWLRGTDLFLDQNQAAALHCERQHTEADFQPLHAIPIVIFLAITERHQLSRISGDVLVPVVEAPRFSYHERATHWEKALASKAAGLEEVISECSRRFRYEKETITAIADGLRGSSSPITGKEFIAACRAEMELDLGELAQKVEPRFAHEELILPHKQERQFQEIVKAMKSLTQVHYGWGTAQAWNESGISVLFAGPPGTGKTMAAEILAIKLDLPTYRIDLSQVVNKYIGETEKNLKRLFDAADISDAILFFDEADSLFGRRTEVKDAHDRYANLEISYLLERMERFKGLAILATNRKKDLDEAFLRRLRYILDFPLPGSEERKRIWRQVIPKTVDDAQVDFTFLARQFALAGGHIRSIVFNACLQCANGAAAHEAGSKGRLTMAEIIVAVKREYDKLGRAVSLEQFGTYAEMVARLEHETEKSQN